MWNKNGEAIPVKTGFSMEQENNNQKSQIYFLSSISFVPLDQLMVSDPHHHLPETLSLSFSWGLTVQPSLPQYSFPLYVTEDLFLQLLQIN